MAIIINIPKPKLPKILEIDVNPAMKKPAIISNKKLDNKTKIIFKLGKYIRLVVTTANMNDSINKKLFSLTMLVSSMKKDSHSIKNRQIFLKLFIIFSLP